MRETFCHSIEACYIIATIHSYFRYFYLKKYWKWSVEFLFRFLQGGPHSVTPRHLCGQIDTWLGLKKRTVNPLGGPSWGSNINCANINDVKKFPKKDQLLTTGVTPQHLQSTNVGTTLFCLWYSCRLPRMTREVKTILALVALPRQVYETALLGLRLTISGTFLRLQLKGNTIHYLRMFFNSLHLNTSMHASFFKCAPLLLSNWSVPSINFTSSRSVLPLSFKFMITSDKFRTIASSSAFSAVGVTVSAATLGPRFNGSQLPVVQNP